MSDIIPADPRQSMTIKVAITATTGALTFGMANVFDLSVPFQVMLSIFVAGVTFVVMYLIEVDYRLNTVEVGQRSHAAATDRQLREGFRTFSWATEIFSRLDDSNMDTRLVAKLVDDMASLDPDRRLVFEFAKRETERLADLMHDLRHGNESVYEGEDRDWMLDLTMSVKESIKAVSLTTVDGTDGGLWLTDLGQRYLRRQEEAIERGVKIQRVFIAEDAARLGSDEFLSICEMHHSLGVEARVLDVNAAPGILANTMFDFIVFDDELSYESVPASHKTALQKQIIILTTRLMKNPTKVRERINRFQKLWDAAAPYNGAV